MAAREEKLRDEQNYNSSSSGDHENFMAIHPRVVQSGPKWWTHMSD